MNKHEVLEKLSAMFNHDFSECFEGLNDQQVVDLLSKITEIVKEKYKG